MFNEEKKIFKHQIDKLTKKCDELSKLVDIERLPKNFIHLQSPSKTTGGRDSNLLINELIPSEKLVNMMSDAITEFSKDEIETDLGLNENCLDVYIGEAIFENGVEKDLRLSLNNIMSFIAVDFYLHETQTSNLNSGNKPVYNLQMSFRVTVDENFIHYLESENISVDVYYIKDNVQAILGKAKISLFDILESENPTNNKFLSANLENGLITNLTRVINNVCTIYYAKDPTLKIGTIHYKMRMRQPILEVIKWYREKNQMLRQISPLHDVTMKRVENEIVNLKDYAQGKVMAVTILITKCINLKISGPPRKIMPYIYYQFYKFDDHYSKTMNGTDPLFQDVEKFDVVYDKTFHDYIEKESLEIMILDDSRALEVEMRQDENKNHLVNLVDEGEFEDLIGIAKVPLKQLLINDLIQNNFVLHNKRGQIAGEIVLNIFWEKVEAQTRDINKTFISLANQTGNKNITPYETKAWEESLIVKLAEVLRYKGFNVNSAFGIFDKDCNDQITLLNFKDIILFTLKFTHNQEELERLAQVIFNGKNIISKLDFYKIFSPLLPVNTGETNNHNAYLSDLLNRSNQSLNSSIHAYNTSLRIQKNNQENQIVESVNINLAPNSSNFYQTNKNITNNLNDLNMSGNNLNNMSMTSTGNNNNFGRGSINDNFHITNNRFGNVNETNSNFGKNSNFGTNNNFVVNLNNKTSSPKHVYDNISKNRSLYEIVDRINDYMLKTNKNTIVEVYKIFDKDANSLIDKNVKKFI